MADETLTLHLRSQALDRDEGGHAFWRVIETEKVVEASRTAILVCDVWDRHWSRGATERVDAMAPRMNAVLSAARERGARIIHAPSDTMPFYEGTLARKRMIDAPHVDPPPPIDRPDPPLPVDASDHGSDTGETKPLGAWHRQHPAISIDQDRDGITDSGQEAYRYLRQQRIAFLLVMGVHTNMCVLGRSFGIKQMVRWGIDVALVRDLTDAMYSPGMPPYVSHDEGTRLVVGYVEKFWCPSIASADLAR